MLDTIAATESRGSYSIVNSTRRWRRYHLCLRLGLMERGGWALIHQTRIA